MDMPDKILVYPETGDAPIRIWGHIKDHKDGWRAPTIYVRQDKTDIAQSLVDALEFYAKGEHIGKDMNCTIESGEKARAALANYRKGGVDGMEND